MRWLAAKPWRDFAPLVSIWTPAQVDIKNIPPINKAFLHPKWTRLDFWTLNSIRTIRDTILLAKNQTHKYITTVDAWNTHTICNYVHSKSCIPSPTLMAKNQPLSPLRFWEFWAFFKRSSFRIGKYDSFLVPYLRITPLSKWLLTMVMVTLPNGRTWWLINGGDPNHVS